MLVPDPNYVRGRGARLAKPRAGEEGVADNVPVTLPYADANYRSLRWGWRHGARDPRQPAAPGNGALALHVLEVMEV